MRTPSRERGFTLIEVMISMVVFMVAMVGLVGLQRISVEGLEKSQQHTSAVNIARYYLNQLSTEISSWRIVPGAMDCPAAFVGSGTFQLATMGACCTNATWPWYEVNAGGADFRVDPYLGHNGLNAGLSIFCINYQAEPMDLPTVNPVTNDISNSRIWKVRVRVVWPKRGQYARGSGWTSCSPTDIDNPNRLPFSEVVELVGVAIRGL